MIKYFKELLLTLKNIERKLNDIDEKLKPLSECVKTNRSDYGDRTSISTRHWND
jgi:hypothetical protein